MNAVRIEQAIADGLIAGAMLREIGVTAAMLKARPREPRPAAK